MALAAVVTVRVPHGLADARLADLRARLPAGCGLVAADAEPGGVADGEGT